MTIFEQPELMIQLKIYQMYSMSHCNEMTFRISIHQKFKNMSKQHVGQTIRTRSFKVRNERIETGVLVKSHKEEKSALKNSVRML